MYMYCFTVLKAFGALPTFVFSFVEKSVFKDISAIIQGNSYICNFSKNASRTQFPVMEIGLTKERSSSGQVSLENTGLNIVNGFFRQFDQVNEVYVS